MGPRPPRAEALTGHPSQVTVSGELQAFIARHRVARLATAAPDARPHVIPICFAFDGRAFYFALDDKPKQVDRRRLRRVRNIEANPQVALVIDEYHEDWGRLAYVLIQGVAAILEEGGEQEEALRLLEARYPQYQQMELVRRRRPVVRITPTHVRAWGATGP